MTYEERQEIFNKDYLSISDIEKLLGLSYGDAGRVIRDIRKKSDRLGMQGIVHVQDYIDYFNLDVTRYVPGGKVAVIKTETPKAGKVEEPVRPPRNEGIPLIRSSKILGARD